jgi:biopolymer transport protein ExbD
MARRKEKQRTNAEDLPITSFSDIAFLLNIYFILVTSLQQMHGFMATIPSADKAAGATSADQAPTVQLHSGVITMNEKNMTLDDFRTKLVSMNLPTRTGDGKVVVIEATGTVPYQQYFEVMSSITKAGGVVGIVKED